MGEHLLDRLRTIKSPLIKDVRGKGLFVGLEVDRERITARDVVDRLLARGILSKDTHGTVVRFAPPLVIDREALDWAVEEVRAVFARAGRRAPASSLAAHSHVGIALRGRVARGPRRREHCARGRRANAGEVHLALTVCDQHPMLEQKVCAEQQ